MTDVLSVAKLCGKVSTALFSGAAVYISSVEHPSRMKCGAHLASTVFPVSYKRAVMQQVPLLLTSSASSLVAFYLARDTKHLAASGLMFAILPYTLLIMLPINKQLIDQCVDRDSRHTEQLLDKWGRLHAVRSVLSFIALVLLYL